ncbi:MAG: flagellar basal body-associated protein FliL [Gammaproteobacteria bacterium]
MAKADLDLDVEAVQPEPKSGALKWIIIGVLGLLLLGGATYAALYFAGVVGGDAAETAAADETAEAGKAKAAPKAPLIYLPMDPFVVNFDMKADVRFMQVTLQVAARDALVIERVKEHTPAIRNGLVMLYSSQDPIVLNTRAGKEALLQQSLEEINKVLKQQSGSAGVENVYFTSFVMQ